MNINNNQWNKKEKQILIDCDIHICKGEKKQ